jgi:hypothetical protein
MSSRALSAIVCVNGRSTVIVACGIEPAAAFNGLDFCATPELIPNANSPIRNAFLTTVWHSMVELLPSRISFCLEITGTRDNSLFTAAHFLHPNRYAPDSPPFP